MRVLFVCSGNICRSPLGAQLLTEHLGPAADRFEVVSAGTIAQDGMPMDPQAAAQSVRLGADPTHSSRYLTADLVEGADLVLTAERSHRSAVVRLVPRASRRAFTMRQAARVLGGLEPDAVAAVASPEDLVALVARMQGAVSRPARPEDDDVEDPYRRSDATHERVADAIDGAVAAIAAALARAAA